MPEAEQHLQVVNDSGFPLQIAVEHLVRTKGKALDWNVRYTEHAWRSRDDKHSGFIDVALGNSADRVVLVVECKRVRDVSWIFLAADGDSQEQSDCMGWVTRYWRGSMKHFGWHEVQLGPSTPEAAFCVMRGQAANGPRPMLERVGSEVVAATEALAWYEKDYRPAKSDDTIRMYFSVVVTTAPLYLGTFPPGTISIEEGTLKDARFLEAPYLRFRKQLSFASDALSPVDYGRHDLKRSRESTVFVVNSAHITEFLKNLEIDPQSAQRFA